MPSLSFVRREIHALERAGWTIDRYTVRRFDGGALVDPGDLAEFDRTTILLEQPKLTLLRDTLAACFRSPGRFWRALATTWRHGKTGGRGRLVQLVYLAEASLLYRLLREGGTEHLHVHFGSNSTEVAMLCRLLGGPAYSFTTHGPEEFDRPQQLHLGEKVHHSAFAVCISSYGRSQMWRWASFADWDKVKVVHCGVDEAFLGSAGPSPVPDNRDFVCVGRLAEQKGQMVLCRAVRRLAEAGERCRVHLIGDGPLRGEIEAFISRHGLTEHLVLHGFMTNDAVRDRITASRAMVLPSFAEGLPVALMEALALGRPVITTYVAGIPELVVPEAGGWLVPAGDEQVLAEAMREVLNADPDKLTRLGRAGHARVRERHDIDQEAAKLASHLRAVFGPPPHVPSGRDIA